MTYKKKFDKTIKPPGDYISDEVQSRLIDLGHRTTATSFEVGDITNMIYLGHARSGAAVTMATICWAVGIFYGKAGGTVRKYAEVAAQYDDAARLKYSVLSFHHFSLAKSLGSKALEMLDHSMDHIGTAAGAVAQQFHQGGVFYVNFDPLERQRLTEGDWSLADEQPAGQPGKPPTPEMNIPWLNTLGRILNDLDSIKVLITRADIPRDIIADIATSTLGVHEALKRLQAHLTKPRKT